MGKRPPVTSTLDLLMEKLEDFRLSLSRVEMYDSFIRASEFGRDCQYSKKAALVFLSHDLPLVKTAIQEIEEILQQVQVKDGK